MIAANDASPAYLAFIAALRKLPAQQREAFLLHHGERLNTRLLGVAMDCSMDAATKHLAAAGATLSTIAGEQVEVMNAVLGQTYRSLSPAEEAVLPYVRQEVRAERWSRRLRRMVRRGVNLAVLATFGWAAWHWRDSLVEWVRSVWPAG